MALDDADRLRWDIEGRSWPQRESSSFVSAGGLNWHVQQAGEGPVALLVHGTGASTHSWRSLAPPLAQRFRVVAMDLPGHGFTSALPPGAASLPGMARALAALVQQLQVVPALAIGHSAGAAIVARMALDGSLAPRALVSLNGALLPLPGLPGAFFSPMARVLASNSIAARIFSWRAQDPAALRWLVDSTGSTIDRAGLELYRVLVSNPAHVNGTLQMMAAWELETLARDLPGLRAPLLLLTGTADRTVPASESARVQRIVRGAELVSLPGLGHLAHEERPDLVARHVIEFFGKSE